MVRGYNNRSTMNFLLGRLDEGNKDLLEGYRLAQHFGQRGFVRWCEGGPLLGSLYQRGQWDEVVERADAFLARLGGEGHYQAGSSHLFRGSIRAARGDDAGAVEDAARALELSRPVGDPQLSGTTLLGAAFIYMTVGDAATARKLFEESLALIGELGQLGWVVIELHSLAWVGQKLERSDEVLAAVKDEPLQSPWLLAGRAAAEGDFVHTANIFGEAGDVTAEAFYRLCAAQTLAAQGRRSEVDEQLRPALAFYRSVGATRYVRDGERLLAATA
jgi:tetratricopeptide (TPR) repeat protein